MQIITNFINKFYFLQKISIILLMLYSFIFLYLVLFKNEKLNSLPKSTLKSESIESTQGVYMEGLDRVEFQDGIKKWRMEAMSATYKENSGNALFKDPIVSVFSKDSPKPTMIFAKSARVRADNNVVRTALLEGDVKMLTSDNVVIESQVAEYSGLEMKVVVPDNAKVSGDGYWVKGSNLIVFTEPGILEFGSNVESFFDTTKKSKSNSSLKSFKKF
jgi:LPS export ABC transporter protein LptC